MIELCGMKLFYFGTAFLLWLCFSSAGMTQNYLGTDFRAMFMRNLEQPINGVPNFEFSIYAPTGAQVTVTYGAAGDPFFQEQSGTVAPNGQLTFAFNNQILEQENYGVAETRSFHITASNPIRVYAMHLRIFFSDGTAVLPFTACGSDYWITTFQETSTIESQVSLLAYSNNTSITVIPSVTTPEGPAGVPFNVLLQAGETYTIAATGSDLTNTHIFSSDETPFAVFAGHRRTTVGTCSADSHLYEQLIPVNYWGTGFALVPPAQSGGEQVRITAAFDETEIYQDCDELLYTLDAGETITFLNTLPRLISSNNPVQVITFSRGSDCSIYNTGDPNMRLVLPLQKAITHLKLKTNFSFSTLFGATQFEFFHLVMPTVNTGDLTVNGNPIAWTPFDTQPGISFARIDADEIQTLTTINSLSPFWGEQVAIANYDAITMSLGSDTIMVLPPLGSAQISLGPDFSLCPGTTGTLQIPDGSIGTWQDGSQASSFSISEAGTYYVTIMNVCGTATDTVQVGLFDVAEIKMDTVFFACAGQSGTLSALAIFGYNYLWSDGTAGPEITTDVEGTYVLTATSPDECVTEAAAVFINLPLPEVSIKGDTFICEDSVAVLIASPQNGNIIWNTGESDPTITIENSGLYSLIFTDANGCTDSVTASITRTLLPFIFANDTSACASEMVLLSASSPNGEIVWDGFLPNETPEVPPGIYPLQAANVCGLTTAIVTVFEEPCLCEARIPNIFSPNRDGKNDAFEPLIDCDPKGFSMTIFDRWGKEIFSAEDIATQWNGIAADGTTLSEGVYYYIISYFNSLTAKPAQLVYNGWVTLVR